MNSMTKSALVTAAIAGMFLANAGAAAAEESAGAKDEVKCYGVNACKGHGACGGAGHGCGGQNACKGQGFIKTTAEDCKAKGGRTSE